LEHQPRHKIHSRYSEQWIYVPDIRPFLPAPYSEIPGPRYFYVHVCAYSCLKRLAYQFFLVVGGDETCLLPSPILLLGNRLGIVFARYDFQRLCTPPLMYVTLYSSCSWHTHIRYLQKMVYAMFVHDILTLMYNPLKCTSLYYSSIKVGTFLFKC